jgi:hypothetical protein
MIGLCTAGCKQGLTPEEEKKMVRHFNEVFNGLEELELKKYYQTRDKTDIYYGDDSMLKGAKDKHDKVADSLRIISIELLKLWPKEDFRITDSMSIQLFKLNKLFFDFISKEIYLEFHGDNYNKDYFDADINEKMGLIDFYYCGLALKRNLYNAQFYNSRMIYKRSFDSEPYGEAYKTKFYPDFSYNYKYPDKTKINIYVQHNPRVVADLILDNITDKSGKPIPVENLKVNVSDHFVKVGAIIISKKNSEIDSINGKLVFAFREGDIINIDTFYTSKIYEWLEDFKTSEQGIKDAKYFEEL